MKSPFYGKQKEETNQQKKQRENERLQRLHNKEFKTAQLKSEEVSLRSLRVKLERVNKDIAMMKQKREDVARAEAIKRQEQFWQKREEERRAREREEAERMAKWQAELARVAKEAREAQEAQEAREVQEEQEAWEAQAAREAQQREQRDRVAKEAAQAVRDRFQATKTRASTFKQGECRHNSFWPKIDGSHLCSRCFTETRRFAFQCPGCKIVACASCRQILRNKGR